MSKAKQIDMTGWSQQQIDAFAVEEQAYQQRRSITAAQHAKRPFLETTAGLAVAKRAAPKSGPLAVDGTSVAATHGTLQHREASNGRTVIRRAPDGEGERQQAARAIEDAFRRNLGR